MYFLYRDEKIFLCTCFGEVCNSCSLAVLPGPAWVVLKYVLQRKFFTSVQATLWRGIAKHYIGVNLLKSTRMCVFLLDLRLAVSAKVEDL